MCFFLCSYYKLNSLCIFISSYSWSIGGQGHRWCHHWQVFASLLRKKQIDSMLPRFCVISGMNISDTHGCTLWATFWFIPHFHIIYDLLVILNRGTATWHQLFKWFMMYSESNMSLQIILYTTKNCFPKHVILTSLFLDLIKYYIDNCLRKKKSCMYCQESIALISILHLLADGMDYLQCIPKLFFPMFCFAG